MPVGDVHAWSAGWPAKKFAEHIKWGVDRGAYFLGMGEYLDFTSGSQRQLLRGMRDSQRQQIDDAMRYNNERLFKLMEPSKGRWLGLLEGHHYHEFVEGTTTDQELCQMLAAPFLGTSTLLDIRLGGKGRAGTGCTVTLYAHHGAGGGGRKQGGHLHRVEDLLSWIEADIYLMGHTHAQPTAPVDRLYRTRDGHLYHRTKILARTGGFLRGYAQAPVSALDKPAGRSRGSYVEQSALSPSALGGIVLSLGIKRITNGGKMDIIVPDVHVSL